MPVGSDLDHFFDEDENEILVEIPKFIPEPNRVHSSLRPGERFDLVCPDCNVHNLTLRSSQFGLFYGCLSYPDCRGSHSARRDGTPKGIPGNAETRRARKEAYFALSSLWESKRMTEVQAGLWLRERMKLPTGASTIASMDKDQCKEVEEAVKLLLKGPSSRFDRVLGS